MNLKNRPIWLLPAISVAVALAAGAAIFAAQLSARQSAASPSGIRTADTVQIGGPFTLINQDGETVTEASYRGKAMLIYFGFTYCPDICPTSLQVMAAALAELDPESRAAFQPILISVDPERDTPQALAQYVDGAAFPDNLVGLTGSVDQVREAASAYRVYFSRVEDEALTSSYTVDHSSLIFLMNREGRFVEVFAHGTTPDVMAARLQRFLDTPPVQS